MPMLILLAMDGDSMQACGARSESSSSALACVHVAQWLGIEAFVAKYITMSVVTHCGSWAVWLDFDVYLPADPTVRLKSEVTQAGSPPLALGRCSLVSNSLSPSIIVARGAEASRVLLEYGSWLYEHPYLQDHQGWDAMLHNKEGDFGGRWDYKGRNITSTPDDGLQFSFAASAASGHKLRFAVLGPEFASGDGILVPQETLAALHFWGARQSQQELFDIFYPFAGVGFSPAALAVVSQSVRRPTASCADSVLARSGSLEMHLTAITYADGCCSQSVERNRQSALDVGVDSAHAYGRRDLDPEWRERHAEVLAQRKGAGWWLWKPYLVLKTLRSDIVPWNTGVVIWLDAGNFYTGHPSSVVARALRASDISAMKLKCCIESDWTSVQALRLLDGLSYDIADTPQLGAYFLLFRKTTTTLAFVEDWLRHAEEPAILMESGRDENMENAPGYQRHMADQSIFSVLFKQRGFEAMSLEEGHRVVQLDRWRE